MADEDAKGARKDEPSAQEGSSLFASPRRNGGFAPDRETGLAGRVRRTDVNREPCLTNGIFR